MVGLNGQAVTVALIPVVAVVADHITTQTTKVETVGPVWSRLNTLPIIA